MSKLNDALNAIKEVDSKWSDTAQTRVDNLIKPVGSMGKLESYYVQLSAINQTLSPLVDKRAILVFSGDHGVIDENVAVCPQDVTLKQTLNFVRGYTGVCALAKQAKAKLIPVDVGVNATIEMPGIINKKIAFGTKNLRIEPAMTREQAIRAIEVGIETAVDAIDEGYNILATGEMGICNTTPSAAILSVFGNVDPEQVTGMGANLDDERVKHKINVVRDAIRNNNPDVNDPIDVLAKVGGFELGAMCGAFIGAASKGVPIVVDGFIATVSALVAVRLNPKVKEYLIPSHKSKEKGAKFASELLGVDPPLDLDMRLGEGTGGALMFNILEAACFMGIEMITFDEAGIGVV
ncbi:MULTISPECIES: nicotinate-nucleotide--dimethylbenzimidazole phosphoribosyltransferase [unclassified Fusibacter]|uniref:nicotinate-nucleotide--dimethylbenzimidazole phosphoribosyltransferase n=1 Tax=unclassified Fusibacter TaxID=2624464 RepID=UPI001011D231|nr:MULTISPECIES: nicotinate-nucleotide--dimethylbenzimidazole phosphoribosyltransferase [unclassified Fusibacter]MCK8059450.1 nicotinate-nucleotide--dimethylbenzimidazole phosphoribosyltransferase [Fusibacter sp. A2]NPE21086.1 nicotinate-nucleotide--dimethylbenzimidazole phosphoribosyltransferase [Fusibacter sp. A1]RXV62358.1 nicotinate-nucleotide--dimethylbenzimidazole phosphoribosyltransferase [Fusibacter sp. A1]